LIANNCDSRNKLQTSYNLLGIRHKNVVSSSVSHRLCVLAGIFYFTYREIKERLRGYLKSNFETAPTKDFLAIRLTGTPLSRFFNR
jgi:hypothetical protein